MESILISAYCAPNDGYIILLPSSKTSSTSFVSYFIFPISSLGTLAENITFEAFITFVNGTYPAPAIKAAQTAKTETGVRNKTVLFDFFFL